MFGIQISLFFFAVLFLCRLHYLKGHQSSVAGFTRLSWHSPQSRYMDALFDLTFCFRKGNVKAIKTNRILKISEGRVGHGYETMRWNVLKFILQRLHKKSDSKMEKQTFLIRMKWFVYVISANSVVSWTNKLFVLKNYLSPQANYSKPLSNGHSTMKSLVWPGWFSWRMCADQYKTEYNGGKYGSAIASDTYNLFGGVVRSLKAHGSKFRLLQVRPIR